jgi:hypothetical protein
MNKRALIVLLGLLPGALLAQNGGPFTINGVIDKVENYGVLFVQYTPSTGQHRDTTFVKEGRFSFAGTVNNERQKGQVIIYSEPQRSVLFYLEPGAIEVSSTKDGKHFMVGGTPLNKDLQEYNSGLYKMLDSINAAKSKVQKEVTEFDQEIKILRLGLTKRFIQQHPLSPIGLDELEFSARSFKSPEQLSPVFDLLDPSLKSSAKGIEIGNRLKGMGSSAETIKKS